MMISIATQAAWQHAAFRAIKRTGCILAMVLVCAMGGPSPGLTAPGLGQHHTFSNPDALLAMPIPWHRQPVRHPKAAQGAHLVITLDRQIHSILLPFVQHYAQKSGLNILVQEGTCGTSANLLMRKQVDMAGYCCPPGASDRLPGLQFHTLGIAAIAILVHPDNPLNNLTFAQVRDIFRGRYFRWSEVETVPNKGSRRRPIQTIGRLHCKLRPGHWRKLLDHPDLFSSRMAETDTEEEMLHQITTHPNAIGYETLWNVLRFQKKVPLKPLAIDGHRPQDDQALLTLRYPLYRVFSLAIWQGAGVEQASARTLVAYLTQVVASLDNNVGLISAARLRQAGWLFRGAELIGEPPQATHRHGAAHRHATANR